MRIPRCLYVHDQDEALDFYVSKLGFQVHADARNGNYRWLTVNGWKLIEGRS